MLVNQEIFDVEKFLDGHSNVENLTCNNLPLCIIILVLRIVHRRKHFNAKN